MNDLTILYIHKMILKCAQLPLIIRGVRFCFFKQYRVLVGEKKSNENKTFCLTGSKRRRGPNVFFVCVFEVYFL